MAHDPSLSFGDKAACYRQYRPGYDETIFDFLTSHLTGARDLAVELGAGSGQATSAIARLFERVIAIEPDARLLEEADFPTNVKARVGAAEEADFDPHIVDAIFSATAFHWMDQASICRKAARWLRPGGVFFPFAYDVFEFEGSVQDYFAEEFEKWRPYRDARLDVNYDYPAILDRSGAFSSVTPFCTETSIELAIPSVVGLMCTMSYAAAYARAESSPAKYFSDVQNALNAFGERIKVTFPIIGALGRAG